MSYHKGKIYIIGSPSSDKYYIGSTILSLDDRFKNHKSDYKRWLNGTYHNCASFELMKLGDAYIKLIEEYPCNSKQELCIREGVFQLVCKNYIVNKRIAGRTHKESQKLYDRNHKTEKSEYYQTHKTEIIANARLRYPRSKNQRNAKRRLRYQRLKNQRNESAPNAILPSVPQIEDPESPES